jgi:5S rRNA maturation endonuclease (ribonuclease M5)
VSTAAQIAAALGGKQSGSGWIARCPCHRDNTPSLSISEGRDGKILLHCHAGCSFASVRAEIHRRGFTLDGKPARLPRMRVLAEYDYCDADGRVLYQVQRWAPKEFRQRRPNGEGGWINNLDGVVRVPYRLPEMLAEPNHTIFIVEGEKDADRLWEEGLTATTNAGGAGARSVWPSLAQWFEGRRVVILPDNDEAGRRHGEHVARTLSDIATSIKVVQLPDLDVKGDVSDWLDAGHTIRELRRLAHYAPSASGSGIPQTARKNTRDSAGSSGLAVCSGGAERDESAADANDTSDASPDDEVEIDRLASLSLIDYGRERKPAAQRLGCPVAILDKAVAAKRHDDTTTGGQAQLNLYDPEPWPDTVDGVDLLDEITSTIRRYVVMDEHSADAAALWVLHTHALDAAYITPRLSISSPEMRCGKTTLLDLLQTMAARPLSVANITTATLFRVLAAAHRHC